MALTKPIQQPSRRVADALDMHVFAVDRARRNCMSEIRDRLADTVVAAVRDEGRGLNREMNRDIRYELNP